MHKFIFSVSLIIILISSACTSAQETADFPPPPEGNPPVETAEKAETPSGSATAERGTKKDTYWVTNPASGARLFVQIFRPYSWNSGDLLPTLILVPGGMGTIAPRKAFRLATYGYTVIVFDPDGRGQSQGEEDYGGFIHQDGLAEVIRVAPSLPGVDPERIGLVSYSYGITMASGALARYPDLPVRFLIDWEGPADRYDTTVGCKPNQQQGWPDCEDDAAWAQREALTFISQIQVPYQRLQSASDHVQPDLSHAVALVNAAVEGSSPWVRLNELPSNQTYTLDSLPEMLPDSQDKLIENLIAEIAAYLFQLASA